MSTRHVSLRLKDEIFERLERKSKQMGQSRSHLAETLLDEGLRMEAHPGIVFRSGPAGRRPGLMGGPDVWEVARLLTKTDGHGHDLLRRVADLTGLTAEQVSVASRYYAEYQDEIDAWIRQVDEDAKQAEAAWRREQTLLSR